ncbi:MAG: hypothetical protein ACLSBL_02515 [Ezakiella massiliensis]
MSNSKFVNGLVIIGKYIGRVFVSSNLYKIFTCKHGKTNSKIVRTLVDEDLSKDSKAYGFIEKTLEDPRVFEENTSVFLRAGEKLSTSIIAGLAAFVMMTIAFALGVIGKKLLMVGGVLLIVALFIGWIISTKAYEGSQVVRFFKYAYRLEEDGHGK